MTTGASVAGELGGELELDVDVGVVADVIDNLDDLAVGEPIAPVIFGTDPVAAVVADAQASLTNSTPMTWRPADGFGAATRCSGGMPRKL
jgi:hypothetical protein